MMLYRNIPILVYVPLKLVLETLILYKNVKVKAHSPDDDMNLFEILTGFLPEVTLAPYLLIYLDRW